MKLYDPYSAIIKDAVRQSHFAKGLADEYSNFDGGGTIGAIGRSTTLLSEAKKVGSKPAATLQTLAQVMNVSPNTSNTIGEHPDFAYIKGTDKTENHNITSVFIDIKGSTNLHKNYDLETIYVITNTIQSAAIHTCLIFGGHIQRLQGDGVFAYFGGRMVDKTRANELAITAASFFSYFVKNDLKNIFEAEGIEDIYTRIGIDFGDDEKVMWASFGIGSCCELTTLSLHTSLAPKMQSYAVANGIVVGQNVKDKLILKEDLFSLVTNTNGEVVKRYIYEDRSNGFFYTQYRFDWYNYLKSLPFIKSNADGSLYFDNSQTNNNKINILKSAAGLISSGTAYTDRTGNISATSTGVKNQDHRFHYGQ